MASTTADLVKAALERLGRLGVGEAVATEDSTLLTARLTKLVETLDKTRVVTVSDINSIDDSLTIPLAWLLAAVTAQEYGLANADELVARYTGEIARISRLSASVSPPVKRIFDQLILWDKLDNSLDVATVEQALSDSIADLYGRNVIYMADADDIPQTAMNHVVRYVAASLAPAEYQPFMADAEAKLRTLSRLGKGIPGARLKVDRSLLGVSRPYGRL